MEARRRASPDELPVVLDLRLAVDDSLRQIVGRGADDRDGSAQFVRNPGHEFHLHLGQSASAIHGGEQQDDTAGENHQRAEAHHQVRAAGGIDRGFERSRGVLGRQSPVGATGNHGRGKRHGIAAQYG